MQPTTIDVVIIGLSEEQPEIDKVVLKRVMRMNLLASFIIYASYPRYELAQSLLRIGCEGLSYKNGCPGGSCDLLCIRSSPVKSYICRQVQRDCCCPTKICTGQIEPGVNTCEQPAPVSILRGLLQG